MIRPPCRPILVVGLQVIAGVLLLAASGEAQFRLVPGTDRLEVDQKRWHVLNVRAHVEPPPSNARHYTYDIKVTDGNGVLQHRRAAPRPLVRDELIKESIDVGEPGTYQVTVVVEFADEQICHGPNCALRIRFEPKKVQRPTPRLFAMLIGIDKYDDKGVRTLNFAESDARAVQRFLTNVFKVPEKQVYMLTSTPHDEPAKQHYRATRDVFFGILSKLERQVGSEDVVLVYYSGHGVRSRREWFLTPVTAALESDGTIMETRFISLHDLVRHLDPLGARHVLLLLDACFSGTGTDPGVRGWSLDPTKPDTERWNRIMAESRYVVTAAAATQLAHEIYLDRDRQPQLITLDKRAPPQAQGYGLFTFSMLQAVESVVATQYKLGIDLKGDRGCGGVPCVDNAARIPDEIKSRRVRVPIDTVYDQLARFMREFWSRQLPRSADEQQTPGRYVLQRGVPIDFRHHEELQ